MGLTVAEKIIHEHLVGGRPVPGERIAIRIDQTLTQDATGTMAFLQLEALGVEGIRTELSLSYVDHNMVQSGFENADDHRYLQSVAKRYGVRFSRPGNGICHQVHFERFALPGKTLLGSDSHTPTAGGMGALGMGAGGLDVALAMAGEPFWMTYPDVTGIRLTGKLRDFISAKDVVLKVLSILTTKGNVGTINEYFGDGLAHLQAQDRATIANMGAETGVTTSIFPSDEITRAFLRVQDREDGWRPLQADSDAVYSREIEIDLGAVEPLAACPHSPGNVVPIGELKGTRVDQVCIGSCTNSSFRDLAVAAEMLAGRKVSQSTGLVIGPGSRQVLTAMAKSGHLASLIESGARIAESTCGFCIGNGMAPPTDAISLRTINRNFEGRSGTASAQVYLVSPEVAAAAAITGEITDPRELGMPYPSISVPDSLPVDDGMTVLEHDPTCEPIRGPNIGPPPLNDSLPDRLAGKVQLVVGDKITTDHIMPAGKRLIYRSNIDRYSDFVFEGIDPAFPARCRENLASGSFNFIVGGQSYGQGSSREHAAICPMHLGVKAVFARSFERIHAANLVNFGILPLLLKTEEDHSALKVGHELEIVNPCGSLAPGVALTAINHTTGREFEVGHDLSRRDIEIVLAGGLLNWIRRRDEKDRS
jgi:aconitate hydratase